MDNLAHAGVSLITTALVSPKAMKQNPRRMALASVVVANLPDIDFLLNIFGQVTYHFHHRGLTHSFLGLGLMVPLGIWLQKKICGDGSMLGRQRLVWVLCQLLGSHFFLDYLTSYGVMFFYPAALDRFAFPLMFIIDPMVWLLTGISAVCLALFKGSPYRALRSLGLCSVTCLLAWWCLLIYSKYRSEREAFPALTQSQVLSFPGPLAPLLWLVVQNNGLAYDSSVVSFMTNNGPKVFPQTLGDSFKQDKICSKLQGVTEAEASFKRYQTWASWVICEDFIHEQACLCHSMRYVFNLKNSQPYFGSVKISGDGHIEFVPLSSSQGLGFFERYWIFDPS